MAKRQIDIRRLRTEKRILRQWAKRERSFPGDCARVERSGEPVPNPRSQEEIGLYHDPRSRRYATVDFDIAELFRQAGKEVPTFLEAGPRRELWFDPVQVNAAIVTAGGLAPGLNSVVHSIVSRHVNTYGLNPNAGSVIGIYDGFKGLLDIPGHKIELDPAETIDWLREGGSNLGNVRYFHPESAGGLDGMVSRISQNLELMAINILYVIGGDGSQEVAHRLARANPRIAVMGIPKTMDNDILWARRSFGFDTSVTQATRAINTLHFEAQSTRRVGILKFFGAESGFVVAHAALASGQVDLVLIPEAFLGLRADRFADYWDSLIRHLATIVTRAETNAHAIIVVAEGVETVLAEQGFSIEGRPVRCSAGGRPGNFVELLKKAIRKRVRNVRGETLSVFTNEPRHYIRSGPANAHDQVFCERLGALAVDNALAGFTDCMISDWLSEYVLVPLELVVGGQKSVDVQGMFWKQVENSTGQPNSPLSEGGS
ncbi:MAG: hypothetical protein D6696_15165 [Acidobacteria bacterium]|nr:MAG: hypothetical protein D6696_15165 [Acidobacteriota bacterium]